MFTTYSTVVGDTFALIARKQFGDDTQGPRIASANPGVTEPLIAGTQITVPPVPGAPVDQLQNSPTASADEVAVIIDGERFRFWTDAVITRSIDAFDTITLTAPFDDEAAGFRQMFVPLSFKSIQVLVGGVPLFTGTMVSVDPGVAANSKVIKIAGYSLPGVLNDCNPQASKYPLEFKGQTVQQIAETLAAPFGITVVFDADPGAKFKKIACESDKKVLSFLIDLAKQRNLIIASNEQGELVFKQSLSVETGPPAPVARFTQGASPLLSVVPAINPQEYYSTVTGIEPPEVGTKGSQYTAKNTRAKGLTRPMTFTIDDAKGGEVKTAVDARLARMFANVVTYTVKVQTWRDSRGDLWAPNTFVTVTAPDAMIYEEYLFLLRSVAFSRPDKTQTATLNLVLPGAFSGEIPGTLPWD